MSIVELFILAVGLSMDAFAVSICKGLAMDRVILKKAGIVGLWCLEVFKLMLAIATSIDALAVGVTFAFLKVNIVVAVSVIGVVTCACSIVGVKIGNIFGSCYKKKAEIGGWSNFSFIRNKDSIRRNRNSLILRFVMCTYRKCAGKKH